MKKEIKLNVDENKTIVLFVDSQSENQDIVEMIKKGARDSFVYFDNIKKIRFGVELIYSRKEFDKKIGYKTESWVTAHSFGSSFIIFSPLGMEKYTSHNRNEFIQIITHETSHIMLKKLNTDFCTWMNEGIAQNIAGQKQKARIDSKNTNYFLKESLFKNSNYEKFISRQGYEISYKLVRFLMTKYDKETIIRLLQVKYDFTDSSRGNICKILDTDSDKLIDQFKKVLENV